MTFRSINKQKQIEDILSTGFEIKRVLTEAAIAEALIGEGT